MFDPGAAYFLRDPVSKTEHLYFIIHVTKEEAPRCVLCNATTWVEGRTGQDASCVLVPGDHPFIKHKSYILYKQARRVDVQDLRKVVRSGLGRIAEQPCSPELLDRLVKGALASQYFRFSELMVSEDEQATID